MMCNVFSKQVPQVANLGGAGPIVEQKNNLYVRNAAETWDQSPDESVDVPGVVVLLNCFSQSLWYHKSWDNIMPFGQSLPEY